MPEDNYYRDAELLRVIDGDTFVLSIDLGFGIWVRQHVRLAGLDTPEVRGTERLAGKFVAEKISEWLSGRVSCVLASKQFSTGKYGRCLGEIYFGDLSINQWLLEQGLAWQTDSSGRVAARDVSHLHIPPGIKQQVREAQA
tara:strand:- start:3808 stop:4230 length:423 start_codon:yes stop_codon:yes gene_type:complete